MSIIKADPRASQVLKASSLKESSKEEPNQLEELTPQGAAMDGASEIEQVSSLVPTTDVMGTVVVETVPELQPLDGVQAHETEQTTTTPSAPSLPYKLASLEELPIQESDAPTEAKKEEEWTDISLLSPRKNMAPQNKALALESPRKRASSFSSIVGLLKSLSPRAKEEPFLPESPVKVEPETEEAVSQEPELLVPVAITELSKVIIEQSSPESPVKVEPETEEAVSQEPALLVPVASTELSKVIIEQSSSSDSEVSVLVPLSDPVTRIKEAQKDDVPTYVACIEQLKEDGSLNSQDESGEPLITWAVTQENLALVMLLLNHKAKVDAPDLSGNTALMVAAGKGSEAFCELLLHRGANAAIKNKDGMNALMFAAAHNNLACCLKLLQKDVELNEQNDAGSTAIMLAADDVVENLVAVLVNSPLLDAQNADGATPLMLAASADKIKTARLLIDSGADLVTKTDKKGNTALHLLAASTVCSILIQEKSDLITGNIDSQNDTGFTPLMQAVWASQAEASQAEACEALINKGADVEVADNDGNTALHLVAMKGLAGSPVMRCPFSINTPNEEGFTPLMLATYYKFAPVCDELTSLDALVGFKDLLGNTVLHIAAGNNSPKICRYVLERQFMDYTNEEAPILNEQNNDGDTALMCAARYGYEAIVSLLVRYNAQLDLVNKEEKTAITIALEKGRPAIDEILSQAYIEYQRTALINAIHAGDLNEFIALLETDAKVEGQDHKGRTILMAAVIFNACDETKFKERFEIVKLLLNHPDIDLNTKDSAELSALVWAASKGHLPIVELFFEKGADRKDVQLAFQMATVNGHEERVEYLASLLER